MIYTLNFFDDCLRVTDQAMKVHLLSVKSHDDSLKPCHGNTRFATEMLSVIYVSDSSLGAVTVQLEVQWDHPRGFHGAASHSEPNMQNPI